MARRPALRALGVLIALSGAAQAQSFRASYSAPADCPDRAAFVQAVEQRLSGWRHSDDGAVDRTLKVVIEPSGAGFAGTVSLDDAEGARQVDGAECESVVRALSLITAVSLDPAAALAGEEPAAPPPAPPIAVTPEPRRDARPPPVDRPPARARGPSLAIGAGAALLFGPAPSPLYGVEGSLQIGDGERRFIVRLAVAALTTGSVDAGSAPAHFELLHGELGGCYRPIRERVSVTGCAVFDAGRMEATGEPSPVLVQTERSTRLWLAAGARMGVGVKLVGPLELGASAGLLVPVTRQSYVFENPEESVHESAPVALDLRLGLGVLLF